MTVYVTQETNVNYVEAERWGKVEFLTANDFNNMRGSLVNERLVRSLKHGLRNHDPESDWIVVSGSPYVAAAVFLILGLKGHRRVQILRWDNRDFVYRPLHVEIPRAEQFIK